LFGAPPVNPELERPRAMGEEEATESTRAIGRRRPPEVDHAAAIPRFKRDSDIPWEAEAQVWEVLDPA
jgi:hypothetical protein